MSPQEALAEIEELCNAIDQFGEPEEVIGIDDVRVILAKVQPRYWLPTAVDQLVVAYLQNDLGAVHRIIGEIVDRDYREREASR